MRADGQTDRHTHTHTHTHTHNEAEVFESAYLSIRKNLTSYAMLQILPASS